MIESAARDVRSGSLADIGAPPADVRIDDAIERRAVELIGWRDRVPAMQAGLKSLGKFSSSIPARVDEVIE